MRKDMIDRRSLGKKLIASIGWLLAPIEFVPASAASGFSGNVVAEWLPDGRLMKLVGPFEYVSASGTRWPVPDGATVDGASIPKAFWSVIGGPFEGVYRAPSVIHDYYCDTRTRPSADVHKVFHEAMLAVGVGQRRAWLMYQAVSRFGPTWPDPKLGPGCDVADEAYDFDACARNSSKPPVSFPSLDQAELSEFIKDMGNEADPADLEKLRSR